MRPVRSSRKEGIVLDTRNADWAARYLDLLKKTLTASVYDESAWSVLEAGGRRGLFGRTKAVLIKLLGRKSLLLVNARPYDRARRNNGEDWPMFGFTMVGHQRLDNIRTCIETTLAEGIPGDIVECGVWRGGCAIFARAVLQIHGVADRKIWLADSFEGMPALVSDADKIDRDLSALRYLSVSQREVENNFRRFDLLDAQVGFVKGWFSESLPAAPIGQIAVLRLDGDHHSSTMDALNGLYGRVSKGGFVIVDDYHTYAGCKAAVTEFREAHGITSELTPIDDMAVYWRV